MKKIAFSLFISLAALIIVTSCNNKHDEPDVNKKGSLILNFEQKVGADELVLNTGTYTNTLGQAYNISKFNYYISNIKLKKADGSEYVVPQNESYFLIKSDVSSSQMVTLPNIPEGDYAGFTFTIGVDSLRCTKDISERTGVLDPSQDMYWAWNSGYIFVKLEGTSPNAPLDSTSNTHPFVYHIGGFGGYSSATVNNIKVKTLSFPENALVRQDHSASEVHLAVDASKILSGVNTIDFSSTFFVMGLNPTSSAISANYANMFSIEHIHNH